MGVINGGYYFNVLYLTFHKSKIIDKVIEGPIPVCENVFENLKTCNYVREEDIGKAGDLIPHNFHGKVVRPHRQVQCIF